MKKNNCNAPIETFNRVVSTIQTHMITNQDWELLRRELSEIPSAFKEAILSHHPNLTPSDFKLINYLKLKLPTREIASLFNITEESVRKHKFRLRQKLNLEGMSIEEYVEPFSKDINQENY